VINADGAALFLDLNPAGQWRFLPHDVAEEATLTIARWLIGKP
jgi:hypothetical protein